MNGDKACVPTLLLCGGTIEELEAELQGESLARAVRVVARVDLDANRATAALKWPP